MKNKKNIIELPYHVGQDVYFMENNHIVHGTIARIKILIVSEKFYTVSKMDASYCVVAGETEQWFTEHQIFIAPEALTLKLLEDLD